MLDTLIQHYRDLPEDISEVISIYEKMGGKEHLAPKVEQTAEWSQKDAWARFEKAKTGTPFTAQLIRGTGSKERPYASPEFVPQEPVLGPGKYTTSNLDYAKAIGGPSITIHDVSLKNPLVIRTDAEWVDWIRKAGWKYANPFGQDVNQTSRDIKALRKVIEDAGHDGVIIDPSEAGDAAKTMWDVFGLRQVVEFNKTQAEPGVPYAGGQNADQIKSPMGVAGDEPPRPAPPMAEGEPPVIPKPSGKEKAEKQKPVTGKLQDQFIELKMQAKQRGSPNALMAVRMGYFYEFFWMSCTTSA